VSTSCQTAAHACAVGPATPRKPRLREEDTLGKRDVSITGCPSPRAHQAALVIAGECASRWRGIEKLAAKNGNTSVIRCAGPAEELRAICQRLGPSVLIADLDCVQSLLTGQEAPPSSGALATRILAETPSADERLQEALLLKGCWGTVHPTAPARLVWRAVQSVIAGQYWVSRATLTQMVRRYLLAHTLGLTGREIEILQLVANGHRNHEIAQQLFISVETVRWHLRSLYNKLGVHDRLSAAMFVAGLAEAMAPASGLRDRLAATGSD